MTHPSQPQAKKNTLASDPRAAIRRTGGCPVGIPAIIAGQRRDPRHPLRQKPVGEFRMLTPSEAFPNNGINDNESRPTASLAQVRLRIAVTRECLDLRPPIGETCDIEYSVLVRCQRYVENDGREV